MPSQRTRHISAAVLGLLAAFLLALTAAAQASPAIDTLTIIIWPEFDQQAALVFYTGEVTGETTQPVSLTFPIPPSASIHAVAYQLPDGQLANATFRQTDGLLTLTSPNGTFHVEFYDTSLIFDGEVRHYRLDWASSQPVNHLKWQVQQPAGATNLSIAPGQSTLSADRFGLPLYTIDAGEVPAGEVAGIEVSYIKPTAALTADVLAGGAATAPESAPLPGRISNTAFMVVMGVIIAALAGVAGYFYSQSRMPVRVPAAAPAEAPSPVRPLKPLAEATGLPATEAEESPSKVEETPSEAEETPAEAEETPSEAEETPAEAEETPAETEPGLTEREREVLALLAQGLSNHVIGERLGISHRTVARHRENMMKKLDLHSRTELVMHAIRIGLIDLDRGE